MKPNPIFLWHSHPGFKRFIYEGLAGNDAANNPGVLLMFLTAAISSKSFEVRKRLLASTGLICKCGSVQPRYSFSIRGAITNRWTYKKLHQPKARHRPVGSLLVANLLNWHRNSSVKCVSENASAAGSYSNRTLIHIWSALPNFTVSSEFHEPTTTWRSETCNAALSIIIICPILDKWMWLAQNKPNQDRHAVQTKQ